MGKVPSRLQRGSSNNNTITVGSQRTARPSKAKERWRASAMASEGHTTNLKLGTEVSRGTPSNAAREDRFNSQQLALVVFESLTT